MSAGRPSAAAAAADLSMLLTPVLPQWMHLQIFLFLALF